LGVANWISGAVKHPGALHAELHVPQGEKIPAAKLASAAKAPGKLGQRARLAQTLKGMHKYAKGGLVERVSRMVESPAEKQVNKEFSPQRVAPAGVAGGESRRAAQIDRAEQDALKPSIDAVGAIPPVDYSNADFGKEGTRNEGIYPEKRYATGGPVNVHGIPIPRSLTLAKQKAARG
jgi:hypothetical protein